MHNWNDVHGWMAFDSLDECCGLTQAFTIGYRFTDDHADPWTCRFDRFKAKDRGAVRGGVTVMAYAVRDLVRGLGLDASKTVFVPALSSAETVASEKGVLWRMTQSCAQFAGAGFAGDAITKKAHRPLHKSFTVNSRRKILDMAGFKSNKILADNILIFDDLITRGATMSRIALAMLHPNPQLNIYGVALGKTERWSYIKSWIGIALSNDHVPEKWDRLWRKGEEI